MPTIVVSSIGTTGRDYSTLQAWEDACPANLVTADQVWKGECYNDSEFTAALTISGITTDATRYVWLTAAAGQSFQDHADVRTNPLYYDQSKGVGIKVSSSTVISNSVNYTVISRLQVWLSSGFLNRTIDMAGSNCIAKDCIFVSSYAYSVFYFGAVASNKAINCAFISLHSGTQTPCNSGTYINCTNVRPSGYTAGGTAFARGYGLSVQNSAVFGFTTFRSGTGSSYYTGSYNGSDCSADAQDTNSTGGLTFSACFESTTNDFRLKSGSPLIDAGNTDATNAPNDITGTARDATTDGDVGAWEYSAGGGGGADTPEHLLRARRPGVTWINDRGA